MKTKFNGVRFNIFISFFFFSIAIVSLIGLLITTSIKPYYRNIKLENVEYLSNQIINNIINNDYIDDNKLKDTLSMTINNDACIVIYNDEGTNIYSLDGLGQECIFNQYININDTNFIPSNNGKPLLLDYNDNYSKVLNSPISSSEMIIYGKLINANYANYYLFINTPLEPIESITSFILNQFGLITFIVIVIAIIISLFMSSRISKPIELMKRSANKLSKGNYDTYFESKSFNELNDLADTLNQATEKLSSIDELRRDLIANISHDIKTPLTMIKGYTEMVKDISWSNDIKRDEHLNNILNEVNYLDKLVVDMQDLTKMEVGYVVLNRSNFDISNLIYDLINSFSVLLAQNNIELKVNVRKNIICYGDELKLSRVIYNFISNAIKYSKENGLIIINLTTSEQSILFEVIDNGIGISKEDLGQVWERYFKIDKQFSRDIDSTGLGLAISKAILVAHKAKYGVDSKIKKGSRFYFELPIDYTDENI